MGSNAMSITDVGASIIVAFIISTCLFKTCYKVMKMVLGMAITVHMTVCWLSAFILFVIDMCEDAKNDMKSLSDEN